MDELVRVCREFDDYAGPAGEESVWQGGGTIAVPIRLFVALRGIMRGLDAQVVHKCLVCRVEPANAVDAVCPKCQRNRSPRPAGVAPWEVVA